MLPPPGENRTALVTGASSGIGAEIARELAARGHHVVLVARRAERLAELAGEFGAASSVVPGDLSQRGDRAMLPERVAALGRDVDILVNNAALTTVGPVAAADPDAELNAIEVDVAAVVDLCTRFAPAMVDRAGCCCRCWRAATPASRPSAEEVHDPPRHRVGLF